MKPTLSGTIGVCTYTQGGHETGSKKETRLAAAVPVHPSTTHSRRGGRAGALDVVQTGMCRAGRTELTGARDHWAAKMEPRGRQERRGPFLGRQRNVGGWLADCGGEGGSVGPKKMGKGKVKR